MRQPEWIKRNRMWFLPLVAALLLGCCLLGALASLMDVFGTVRGSAAYRQGLTLIQNDEQVSTELGAPIESRWPYSAHGDGAAMKFHLAGPKGTGVVDLRGEQRDGRWTVTHLRVYTQGQSGDREIVIVGE